MSMEDNLMKVWWCHREDNLYSYLSHMMHLCAHEWKQEQGHWSAFWKHSKLLIARVRIGLKAGAESYWRSMWPRWYIPFCMTIVLSFTSHYQMSDTTGLFEKEMKKKQARLRMKPSTVVVFTIVIILFSGLIYWKRQWLPQSSSLQSAELEIIEFSLPFSDLNYASSHWQNLACKPTFQCALWYVLSVYVPSFDEVGIPGIRFFLLELEWY